jgi:hypothetical protein
MTHRTRLITVSSITSLLIPGAVLAQGFLNKVQSGANAVAKQSEMTSVPLETIIGNIIAAALSFVGVILICAMLYAGFLWMTAGGNKEQLIKARGWIINSIIGLLIVSASFAISSFVLNNISGSTSGVQTVSTPSP